MELESLQHFAHMDLTWVKNPEKKNGWLLKFDDTIVLQVNTGGWFFNRYTFVKSKEQSWRVKQKGGIETCIYEYRAHNLLGKKAYELGFRKRGKEGMYNPSIADSFRWDKLEGSAKGMAWYRDGIEIVRFERSGRNLLGSNYTSSVTTDKMNPKWLAVMLATGFLVLR